MNNKEKKEIVVLSILFPSEVQPGAGLFIRERMFRVAEFKQLVVVSPVPWFPFQGLLRLLRPNFRRPVSHLEIQQGIEVYHPKFLSFPGFLKRLDGIFLAVGTLPLMYRLKRKYGFSVIDAHFGYPDGYAAVKLGRWLGMKVSITMRGTEVRHSKDGALSRRLLKALEGANWVFSVSNSLRELALGMGVNGNKLQVVGNGVDLNKFQPINVLQARNELGIKSASKVLITVGGLVERKGFHRVLEILPALKQEFPDIVYLIVGGPSLEGDWTDKLNDMVDEMNLRDNVRFLGSVNPEDLKHVLSAADVFVLSSRNEGWANVILESMACGVPVIASDVGGNAEVVANDLLGEIVPFDDSQRLRHAIDSALKRDWNRDEIIAYARANSWDLRVSLLLNRFNCLMSN